MGLTSTQIVSQVAKRWWPGVVSNDIMPTVYRHIKKGLTFDKKGDLFVLRESRAVSMFE